MRNMNKKYILLPLALFVMVGCQNLGSYIMGNSSQNQSGQDIYNKGKSYIRLEEKRITKSTSKLFFDHPKYLRNDIISSALSSINFKPKGITGFGKEETVFLESEILNLSPHIIDAFSRATPSQYVLVYSAYEKGKGFFKSEMFTILGLFISNNELNIVFSRIQYEPLIEKGGSIFTTADTVFTDPFSIKKNPYWKIIPKHGQRFKKGHSNWLIVNFEGGAFINKEDFGKPASINDQPVTQYTPGNTGTHNMGGNTYRPPVIVAPTLSIKDQLLELKELEIGGLITNEDYEKRKAEILRGTEGKSIKSKFIELRNLREDGFIGDVDYEHKKRDLMNEDEEKERKRNIKDVLSEYLELRDEGFIMDKDYEYKKKQLLRRF